MKRALQAILGVAISGGALWLTLRGKDLGAIWEAGLRADHRFLVPYVGVLLAIHLLRTWRWGILLEPVAKLPFAKLNGVCAVGFMALLLLPFRLGEFARPYLVADGKKVRTSAALSSVVVERVVDGMFTAAMLVLTLLTIGGDRPHVARWRVGGAVIFGAFTALLVFLVVAYRNRPLAVRIITRLAGPISPRLAERAAGMTDAFIHGLRILPGRGKVVLFFALTVAYWTLTAWGMGFLGRAFGIELGILEWFTVLGILIVGVMIPAGPGMVGTFQWFVVAGISLFLPQAEAHTAGTAYAYVLWGVQIVQSTALGVAFLFSRHVSFARLVRAPADVEHGLEQEEAEYRAEEGGGPLTPPGERPINRRSSR
jgi:uncharacterized protein (TIRG00374 family)